MEREFNSINNNENLPEPTLENLLEQVELKSSEQSDKLKAQFIEAINQGKIETEEGMEEVRNLCIEYRSEFEKQADQILEDLSPGDNLSYPKAQISVEIHMALLFREAGLKEYELTALGDAFLYAQNMEFNDWAKTIDAERERLESSMAGEFNTE